MLATDQAIVTRGVSSESSPPAAGYADWTVEASGSGEIVLQISKPAASTSLEALALVKEQSAYTVQRGAIDLETSLDLDVLHRPLTDLVLACDKTLEIVSIRLGESSLPWSPLADDSSQQRITVRLAPPLQGKADPIRVSATAKWNGRAESVLPRIQLENATWQQGRTTVAAEGSLPLRATARTGCRLSSFTPASPLRPSNQWQFQQFAPGAHIRIALDDVPPLVEELSADGAGLWSDTNCRRLFGRNLRQRLLAIRIAGRDSAGLDCGFHRRPARRYAGRPLARQSRQRTANPQAGSAPTDRRGSAGAPGDSSRIAAGHSTTRRFPPRSLPSPGWQTSAAHGGWSRGA